MKYFTPGAAILLALCTASCATTTQYDRYGFPSGNNAGKHYEYSFRTPPMDSNRVVLELDCGGAYAVSTSANLRCM